MCIKVFLAVSQVPRCPPATAAAGVEMLHEDHPVVWTLPGKMVWACICGALVGCYAWSPGNDSTYHLLYCLNPAVVVLL